MATLIHLNAPSGAGKSTLAQRYVDDHPGVLNLDIDRLVPLIGGWRSDFFATVSPARDIAVAMAKAHLRSGSDVVMPQLVTSVTQAERFKCAAERVGAEYVEVALLVDVEEQITRFRGKSAASEVAAQIERAIDAEGGDRVLERIHVHFSEYLAHRPAALRLDATDGVERSFDALLVALAARRPGRPLKPHRDGR